MIDDDAVDRKTALLRSFFGDQDGRFERRVWRAEAAGEVVGTATTGPPRDLFGPWVGELYGLHVEEAHRRQGHGTALHDELVTAWRETGITVGVVELPAPDEETRTFYESRGWRPDGHTRQSLDGTRYVRLRRAIN